MRDDGYTLAEMLAALVIIGLAVGGLAESACAFRMIQSGAARTIGQDRALAEARRGLVRVLARQGPFRKDDSNGLKGGETGFAFGCRGGGQCGAQLIAEHGGLDLVLESEKGRRDVVDLPGVRQARFAYYAADGRVDAWPATDGAATLISVALEKTSPGGPSPLMAARVWTEQRTDCAFDAISADCRAAAP